MLLEIHHNTKAASEGSTVLLVLYVEERTCCMSWEYAKNLVLTCALLQATAVARLLSIVSLICRRTLDTV